MKIKKITIKGERLPVDTEAEAGLEAVYRIGTAARGLTGRHVVNLDEQQALQFVFEDDSTWFCNDETLEDIFPEAGTVKRRTLENEFEIPAYMDSQSTERGVLGSVALKLLKIFKRDEVHKSMRQLAAELEKKQLENLSGLYGVDANFRLIKNIPSDSSKPFLLFLHGTNSSTSGSFGEIAGTALWNYILQTYGDHVLAFQHETLTKSPLENVSDLAKQLPSTATLHLVSHSRGGLVGDILCRYCVSDENNAGFSAVETSFLEKEGRKEDIKYVSAIAASFKQKNISVQRFLRVACPASGTTLASKRLDHFLNVGLNLVGLPLGGIANPIYSSFKNLVIAAVDSKNDVSALPGIEAMNPDSPFIKVLNCPNPSAAIDSPLVIFSGNSRANLNFKALVIIASKLFFDARNDLVVNTASMYNGTKRQQLVQYFFDEGTSVDHFHYFKNPRTNQAMVEALRAPGDALIPGFAKLENGVALAADRNALLKLDGGQVFKDTVTGKRPIAVIIPGIMGSNLSKNGNLVWINYFRFIAGELSSLTLGDNDGVLASSIVKTSYKKLTDHLSESYDVVTFAYDWRQQLSHCAAKFNEKIIALLKVGQPVKIIGHSMGGVLVRDFILQHPQTWERLNNSPGFRLLFLGSPLGGSFRIPYVLYGKDPIIDKLSKIDLFNTRKDLLKIFSNFPGLLSLLPLSDDADNDFAKEALWKKISKANGDSEWPIPSKQCLDEFKAYRDLINAKSKDIDFSRAAYVAGKDKSTPSGYELDEDGKLIFLSTAAGDQSVTWDSGIPKKIIDGDAVYYCDVSHGSLANDPALFKAIDEILATGSTALLKKTRPAVRATDQSFKTPEINDFDLSAEGVENTILGIGEEKPVQQGVVPVKVSISNGDLKYASYPLLAGHFINDGILYAEKAIDYNLRGVLTERYQLGLYPGEIGSSEVVITQQKDFNGAIIVGLGDPGSLTAFQLTQTIEQGVAKYLLNLNNRLDHGLEYFNSDRLGISSLAIACSYGGLSIEKSLRAIVMGVQNANAKITKTLKAGAKTVTHVEFVEQYEDRALACLYVLHGMENEEDQSLNMVLEKRRIRKLPGSRERLPIDVTDEWWTRIHVKLREYDLKNLSADLPKTGAIKGLQFNISTGGAREEQRDLFTSREIVQELINDMSGNNQWTPQLAKTIFELLVPNDFKEQLKKQSNINWIVDKETASYPWELLQDGTHNAKPLCINAGMVRQLATEDYRVKIKPVTKNAALVIADPDLKGFANQLQGALEEGEMVSGIFEKTEFKPLKISRGSAAEIIQAIFSDEYKIIHLAGHGMFNEDPSKGSGMVIGNNVFLSTREICQMSTVPELVFVNCCFLGKIDGAAEALYRNRFRLAANIGTQLIENGVKVVIAAGWAVDDAAALEFTRVFYECMFEGYEFGRAVREAREKVYEKFSYTNTWGAYQCYGDQFYTLRSIYRKPKPKEYVIPKEAEIDLNNLLNKLEISGYRKEDLLTELDAISLAVEKAGIRDGAITEREALVYAGLCLYEQAINKFESLLAMENASFSFAAMERYCNVRPKYLVMQLATGKNKVEDLRQRMEKVIDDLQLLLAYSATSERLNMMGSALKAKAILHSTREKKIEIYCEAAACYHRAYERQKKTYPLLNWLQLEALLVMLGHRQWGAKITEGTYAYHTYPLKETVKLLQDVMENNLIPADETNYWEWSMDDNARLLLMVIGYKAPGYHSPRYEDVLQGFADTWQKGGSIGKKTGEIENIRFLADAIQQSDKNNAALLKERLQDLIKQLSDKI